MGCLKEYLSCPLCGGEKITIKDKGNHITITCETCGWQSINHPNKGTRRKGEAPNDWLLWKD